MIAGCLVLAAAATAPEPADRFPKAAASYLVSLDGRELWARRADAARLPASLTKIMTGLVLLEGSWKPEAEIRVSRRAASETGSRLGLRPGESMRADEALTAMLVASANDACLALAEAAGPDGAFVAAMNARAASLGLAATHFDNPCGHDSPGQRSSARDLSVLARAALAHEEFATRVALPRATVRTLGGRSFDLTSGNAILGRVPGARGVKSGYTPGAGKCLVGLAERDGKRALVVLLDAPDRWWTAAALIEEAFDAAAPRP